MAELDAGGALSIIWNDLCNKVPSLKETGEDFQPSTENNRQIWSCKIKYSIDGVERTVEKDGEATKASAKRACQIQIIQRHFKLQWERFVAELCSVHYARFGDKIQLIEGLHVEFKGSPNAGDTWSLHWALKRMKETWGKYTCAFLNSDSAGGRVYYGVHDSGMIQGIEMTADKIDPIKLQFEDIKKRSLDPVPTAAEASLEFKTVENDLGKSLYLIVLHVRATGPSRLFWFDNVVYERRDGAAFAMPPSKIREILKREWTKAAIAAIERA